jgi:ATP-dependent Lhr-like helicase
MFHPVVRTWFERRFPAPTSVQAQAWPPIAAGQDVLLTAPTGSGKTLAAFLACLDDLIRRAIAGTLEERTYVVYVSPLKALSNDVRRNLEDPLAGTLEVAAELGHPALPVRALVRTGDTSMKERQQAAKRPPHILVTTPESLFILLTSESGRRGLRAVRTVIVDEIHALAPDKRGAHLALSLERLAALTTEPLQRVGLSATVQPLEVAARLLVGAARPLPVIVDAGEARARDLRVETLGSELGAVCTNEQWAEIYDRLAELVRGHRSTLVFVNTRRLVERVALHLGERLGPDSVAAHHGSLSRQRRFQAEQRLKAGSLKAVVATASLELGIDVGAVDLVCLVGSPRSISTGVQRVGRSGHAVGGTPKGRLFPLTRDQLIECAALVRGAQKGILDAIALREAPLDILAQQIVAAAACDEWDEDALYALCARAAPYAALSRTQHDAIVDMLSEGIATSRGRSGALLHRDAVNHKLRGRRGARLAALTSGGAIPDTALFEVVLEPDGTLVGTVDEDFAIESMAGDVILLGNNSWRIRRVENGRVRVEDAAGAAPTIPFWFGEGPGRTRELSSEVGELRAEVIARAGRDGPEGTATWLCESCGLDRPQAELLRDYVRAGHAALGAVPTPTQVIAERFFDEAGGIQLVIHAPLGARLNRAWGMALRKRFCRSFDFELQAAATDDGIVLSLGPQHSFPLELIFQLVRPDHVAEVLTQAALQAPMFETRWRWNATRSLALLRTRGGKKVPPNLQRMRAQDLLASVFPGQVACQDNHGGGPIEVPDHPLVHETVRDCLCEPMDAAGLVEVMHALERGDIQTRCRELPEPSVFAHEILNANPYAFLDDAPLEERRARAVSVRRGLPAEVAEGIGGLDAGAIAEVVAEAQPDVRGPDELHDLLLDLGGLPHTEGTARGWGSFFAALVAAGRAGRLTTAGGASPDASFWIPAERLSLARAAWPGCTVTPELVEPQARRPQVHDDRTAALAEIVRGHMASLGPVTTPILGMRLAFDGDAVEAALLLLETAGSVMRGRFTPRALASVAALPDQNDQADAQDAQEWIDRRLLQRMNRRTVERLRKEIVPVEPATLVRFLLGWQRVRPDARLAGPEGLREVIAQLQGFEAAAGAWEREIFPARLEDYDPAWLDELCLSGQVVWGRFAPRPDGSQQPSRATPIGFGLRRDLPWLLAPATPSAPTPASPPTPARRPGAAVPEPDPDAGLSPKARDVLAHLRHAGASFLDDLIAGAGRLRAEVEDALWELVAAGRVTGDGFSGLRGLLPPVAGRRGSGRGRFYARSNRRLAPPSAGRWALLATATPADAEARTEALARQYVRRYGVIFRELLGREEHAPPWRDLVRVYRRLELRGELRGGRFVAGLVGEQFALPEALEGLRALRRATAGAGTAPGEVVALSACDPLNLVGILTPGPRVPATLASLVTYRDGVPVADGAPVTAQGANGLTRSSPWAASEFPGASASARS